MNPSPKETGILLDKATRFGERFGFPSLIAILLVSGLLYGGYFVMRYEVFYNRTMVEAMQSDMSMMMEQHDTILSQSEASLELQGKQLRITCAACWNTASDQEEIRRCSCDPK